MSRTAVVLSPVGGPVRLELPIEAKEPELLLPAEKCIVYKIVRIEGKPVRVPAGLDITIITDEIRKLIPLVALEETRSLYYYNEGVYMEDGEAKVESLLHRSFHEYDVFNPIVTPKIVIAHLKGLTMISKDQFDANLNIINMKNGLYDWREGTLYSHTPGYPSLIQIPVNYDPDARCNLIIEELKQVMSEDAFKFMEFAAYCLYRQYPIQKAFILLGPGRTGKSCVLDILRHFVGDKNSCSVSLTSLSSNRFAGSDLFGRLLNVVNEMDSGELLSSDLFKQITGGSTDPVRAERKYQHAFNFVNFAKLAFATNKLPKTRDDTTGFWRRFEILRCDHVFTAEEYDAEILEHLTDPEQLSGFFNLVIGMLPGLIERRAFTDEMTPDEVKEIWEANAVPIVDFADKFVDSHATDQVITKDNLFRKFLEYCQLVGTTEFEWTIRKFNAELKKTIPEFINLRHDMTCRVGDRACKVWYDTRFKQDEFEAFAQEVQLQDELS